MPMEDWKFLVHGIINLFPKCPGIYVEIGKHTKQIENIYSYILNLYVHHYFQDKVDSVEVFGISSVISMTKFKLTKVGRR